jgi:lipopolysaccharide transport system permease protein
MDYVNDIWASRYFWIHLTLSDLRARWRRSFFGMSWCILQPLGMTLLLSFVFGKIFKTDIRAYAPYILSGMIIWEYITATAMNGSLAFVQADAYIKQCRHPLAIYTLRTALTNLIVLSLASVSLLGWVLVVFPQNINVSWFELLLAYPILLMIAWPLATILAYAATRFRDIPYALGLIFQSIWFISPIYFEEKVFLTSDLRFLIDYNPIYHLLELFRAPLLRGMFPSMTNILFCVGSIICLGLLSWQVGTHYEKKVIFYL